MPRRVRLNELDAFFGDVDYPVERERLADEFDDVELVYADGEESLSTVLDRIEYDTFGSPGDLTTEIMNTVPVEGVGEPGQSEGEG